MRKVIIINFFLFCAFCFCNAQNEEIVDIITTKNGDRFSGYITQQIPGKSLKIMSYKIEMTVPGNMAECTRKRERYLYECNEYACFFPEKGLDETIELCDVTVLNEKGGKKYSFIPAVILVRGETLSFVSMDPHEFSIPLSEIKLSEKAPYNEYNDLLLDEIQWEDYILDGQLLTEDRTTGEVKFRRSDGNILSIKRKEINYLKHKCHLRDDRSDFWAQMPYLDYVYLKDGRSYEGFIESVFYGNKIKFLPIRSNTDEVKSILLTEVSEYKKKPNPDYIRISTVSVPEPEVAADLYINGVSYDLCEMTEVRGFRYAVTTSVDSIKACANVGSHVVFKLKTDARTCKLQIALASLEKETVFGVTGIKIKKKGTELWPVIRQEGIIANPDINFLSNDGTYMEADVVFYEPGVYVIWIKDSTRCVVINVN